MWLRIKTMKSAGYRFQMEANLVRLSKFISLVLRHKPQQIGLILDPQGWAKVDELIAKAGQAGVALDQALLREIVASNDKQRFAISPDGQRIRASQGHSIEVDLALEPRQPPERLFHGTARQFVTLIQQKGLLAGRRMHVHLSVDEQTARKVGQRHGEPVIFYVDAGRMQREGSIFFCSENGVWLTEHVPPSYLSLLEDTR